MDMRIKIKSSICVMKPNTTIIFKWQYENRYRRNIVSTQILTIVEVLARFWQVYQIALSNKSRKFEYCFHRDFIALYY